MTTPNKNGASFAFTGFGFGNAGTGAFGGNASGFTNQGQQEQQKPGFSGSVFGLGRSTALGFQQQSQQPSQVQSFNNTGFGFPTATNAATFTPSFGSTQGGSNNVTALKSAPESTFPISFTNTSASLQPALDQDLSKDSTKGQERQERFAKATDIGIIRDKLKKERDQREEDYYKNYKAVNLAEAKAVVGTCQDMCPEFERFDREVSQELHIFEMIKGTENDSTPRVDHSLAVKKYRRSAAGKDPEIFPEDIRPPTILKKTMDYLVSKSVLERTDVEFVEVYNFIRDRGRALRKDFKIQNKLNGAECVEVLEKLTRFLIHSDFVLCELPESKFSWKQNRHQIVDTLTTLLEVYNDERTKRSIKYENEPEFRAYFILIMVDDVSVIDKIQKWPLHIRRHPAVRHALKLHQAIQNKLYEFYASLFKCSKTSYLMACILNITLFQLRKDVIKSFYVSVPPREKGINYSFLKNLLLLNDKDSEVAAVCEHWTLEMDINDELVKVGGNNKEWIDPASALLLEKSQFIVKKLNNRSHSSIVCDITKQSYIEEDTMQKAYQKPHGLFRLPTNNLVLPPPCITPAVSLLNSLPKEVPKKKLDPAALKEAINLICQDLLIECTSSLSRDTVIEFCLRRAVLINNIAIDTFDEIFALMSRVAIVDALTKHSAVLNTKKAMVEDIKERILIEVINEFTIDFIREELSEAVYIANLKKVYLNRWRDRAKKKYQSRLESQERKKKFNDSLHDFPFTLPLEVSPPVQKRMKVISSSWTEFQSAKSLNIVESFMENTSDSFKNSSIPYAKILIARSMGTFTDEIKILYIWLCKLLSFGKGSFSMKNSEMIETLTFVEVDKKDEDNQLFKKFFLLVQSVNVLTKDVSCGTNASIFTFYYDGSNEGLIKNDFDNFVSSMPKSISCLIVFWSSIQVSKETVENILQLNSLTSIKFYVVYAGIPQGHSESSTRIKLKEGVNGLISNLRRCPNLIESAFENFYCSVLAQKLFHCYQRVAKYAVRRKYFTQGVRRLIELLNLSLLRFKNWIIESSSDELAFPPKEFIENRDLSFLKGHFIPSLNWTNHNLICLQNVVFLKIPTDNELGPFLESFLKSNVNFYSELHSEAFRILLEEFLYIIENGSEDEKIHSMMTFMDRLCYIVTVKLKHFLYDVVGNMDTTKPIDLLYKELILYSSSSLESFTIKIAYDN